MNTFFFLQSDAGFDFTKLIAPAITFIGFLIAIIQLSKNNLTRKADFAHRLEAEFFTDDTIACFDLLDYIVFMEPNKECQIAYFRIDMMQMINLPDCEKRIKDFAKECDYQIGISDVDILLLGKLEKIGTYGKRKVIDDTFIYDLFSYYIKKTFHNPEIIKYYDWAKEQEDSKDIYENLNYICEMCVKYEKKTNKCK